LRIRPVDGPARRAATAERVAQRDRILQGVGGGEAVGGGDHEADGRHGGDPNALAPPCSPRAPPRQAPGPTPLSRYASLRISSDAIASPGPIQNGSGSSSRA